MKLITKIRTIWYRWRQQAEHRQYERGWNWVHSAYREGGWSLDEIVIMAEPFGNESWSPFEHGARDAVAHLRDHLEPTNTTGEIETNVNGDPIGVPYYIHPGNMDHTRVGQGPGEVYTVDPEKEKAAHQVEVEMGFRNPRREAIDRRCYTSVRKNPGWHKIRETRPD